MKLTLINPPSIKTINKIMKTEPNKPAHPVTDQMTLGQQGLTKREYFAGLAMQGILSNPIAKLASYDVVKNACKNADALIAQLNKD